MVLVFLYTTDHYSNDDNIKMAYSMAMTEGQAESRDLQVLLVGAENIGKSCLISSFLGEKFVEGQSATEGAEVEVCKIYSKDWKRISDSEKTDLLHHQFIDQFRGSALNMMLPMKSDKNLATFSHSEMNGEKSSGVNNSSKTQLSKQPSEYQFKSNTMSEVKSDESSSPSNYNKVSSEKSSGLNKTNLSYQSVVSYKGDAFGFINKNS